ncbi:MAG: response regulator transcription factor [Bacillota bacterium]
MNNELKVFCVDDEASIRDLYVCAFESANIACKCFSCGEELFSAMKGETPDIILLDIMLDDMDGFEILDKIKNSPKFGDIPTVMVSAKGEEVSKVKGLNMGADDYISKPFGIMELIARVKANVRKTKKKQKTEIICKDIVIDLSLHSVKIGGATCVFTLKEYNLLKMLCENFQTVTTREAILEEVWGTDFFGETRTLDMHIKEVRKKIATAKTECEIETIRGVGYILK